MRHQTKFFLLSVLCTAVVTSAASAQATLRYQFKEGQKLEYVMEQKMKMTMNINNMDIDTKMDMTNDLLWKIISLNSDGGAKVQIKVTRAKLSMDGPTGMVQVDSDQKNEPDDAIGKLFSQIIKASAAMEMTGTMLPTGEMKDIKVSDATAKALKGIPGADKFGDVANPESLKSMMSNLVFPPDAVAKGKTWSNKNEMKTALGKTVIDNTYTYEGIVQKDGAKLDKISVKPAIKIEPDPKSPVKIEVKETKGSGQILFDNKTGRMIESTGNQTMQMQLAIAGMNLTQTIDQNTTIRLKK